MAVVGKGEDDFYVPTLVFQVRIASYRLIHRVLWISSGIDLIRIWGFDLDTRGRTDTCGRWFGHLHGGPALSGAIIPPRNGPPNPLMEKWVGPPRSTIRPPNALNERSTVHEKLAFFRSSSSTHAIGRPSSVSLCFNIEHFRDDQVESGQTPPLPPVLSNLTGLIAGRSSMPPK